MSLRISLKLLFTALTLLSVSPMSQASDSVQISFDHEYPLDFKQETNWSSAYAQDLNLNIPTFVYARSYIAMHDKPLSQAEVNEAFVLSASVQNIEAMELWLTGNMQENFALYSTHFFKELRAMSKVWPTVDAQGLCRAWVLVKEFPFDPTPKTAEIESLITEQLRNNLLQMVKVLDCAVTQFPPNTTSAILIRDQILPMIHSLWP